MTFKQQTFGVLGGGQLGRMSAMAAAQLGILTHVYCPEENCPASQVTPLFTCADYDDEQALEAFARSVDVISYEFENIPVETVRFLKKFTPVLPDEALLEVSQDREKEKSFLKSIGIQTAPWAVVTCPDDIESALDNWGAQAGIVKTARFGYDGKGQLKFNKGDDAAKAWQSLETDKAVIEGIVDFAYEASVIIARDVNGRSAVYPLTRNEHENHILSRTLALFDLPADVQREAAAMANRIADAVNLVGVLALELFVTADGALLANEIAPRTHNSGHWTIDACAVSQFDNHVRCVCSLPVGEPAPHSQAEMINLLGDDIEDLGGYYATEGANVHLYGKTDIKAGRKMGHVTIIKK